MKFIRLELKDHIATVTIDRQDALNAMNLEVISELKKAFESCIADSQVGVIILKGAGEKAFIAGADIKAMQKMNRKIILIRLIRCRFIILPTNFLE